MSQRPLSITVIGWLLVIFGILGLIGMLAFFALSTNPFVQQAMAMVSVPVSVEMTADGVSTALRLLCGIGLLCRQDWARYLFVIYGLAGTGYAYYVTPYPLMMIPGVALFVLALVFLYLPKANVWFQRRNTATTA